MSIKANVAQWAYAVGIEPRRTINFLRGTPGYLKDRRDFKRKFRESEASKDFDFVYSAPMSGDRFESAGTTKGHYFSQDLLVAQWIHQDSPRRHVDVGSRVDGFVANVASFRDIDVLDIRKMHSPNHRIQFHKQDITDLPDEWIQSTDSLSCLHALEHFGLGRYGDPVDPDAWISGLESLRRMLELNGKLYLSVPTGSHQRVEFNSQRVFSLAGMKKEISTRFTIEGLVLLDSSGLQTRLDVRKDDMNSFQVESESACSIWELRRTWI